jgi:predicted molibdopterin-dependent oxidoreductase YjgC
MAPVGGARALVEGVWEVFDQPRSTAGFSEIRQADLVVVFGSDPSRSHPLVKTELVQAAVQRGVPVIVANPMAGGLDRHAADVLQLAPGSERDLLVALAARLLILDGDSVRRIEHLPGYDAWRRSVEEFSPDIVMTATGIVAEKVDDLATRLAAARRPVMIMGAGSGVPGDEAAVARAASALTALLGNDAGLMVLGGRSNVQGLIDVGLHPHLLPGHRLVSKAVELEDLTGRATLSEAGWTVSEWVAAGPGAALGLLLVGVDLVDLLPRGEDPRQALEGAGFSVVVDAFLTSTAERAEVVLPAAILSEREGTTVSADGVRRPLRRALDPPEGVRSDTVILTEIARRMGAALPGGDDLKVEMDRVVGWNWGRSQPRRLSPVSQPRAAAVSSGFLLDAAPQLFHSGSVTTRSALLQDLSPTVAVRLNPVDARALGVTRGEVVAVSSEKGEVLLRARPDRTIRQGTVVVHWVGSRAGASTLYEEADEVLSVKVRKA